MTDSKHPEVKKNVTNPGGLTSPIAPLSPKRGAFPSPKEEIEKAKPYVPDTDPTTWRQPPEPASPTSKQ